MSRLRLGIIPARLCTSNVRARALVIAAGTRLAAALIYTPAARGRGELSSRAAAAIDRARAHDIAQMSYDPHSWICIPIHYAPVELKIGTRRGATDRALGRRRRAAAETINQKPPARCVASLSLTPFSPPPPVDCPPLSLSFTVRLLPFSRGACKYSRSP